MNIAELAARITEAREAYYNAEPILTDAEFDALEDELRALDPDHIALKAVGFTVPEGGWEKHTHEQPMGSLLKVNTTEELRVKWHARAVPDRAANGALVVSEKLDGASLSLVYVEGELRFGVTRGDGITGDVITPNVLKMQGIKRKLPASFTGFIRAEMILPLSKWPEYEAQGYKNPRNAAAGICRRHDGTGCSDLIVYCYQVIRVGGRVGISNKMSEFKLLEALKLNVPFWKLYAGPTALEAVCDLYEIYVETTRSTLDYEIDGLVIEFDDLEYMETLGFADGRPKGARALKFPHENKPSTLQDKRWQVGNSGRVTPVAVFDPVNLAGVTVRNASLHNVANIEALAGDRGVLSVGDRILVSRRNDVIPYVESVLMPGVNHAKQRLEIPTECPECSTTLVMDGKFLRCPAADTCPAQGVGMLRRWVKKLDLKGWGDKLLIELHESGMVKDVADLYGLDADTLAAVETGGKRVGSSTAAKLIKERDKKLEIPLGDLVGSLGIPLMGQSMCGLLVNAGYDTIEKMRAVTVEELEQLDKMGTSKADAFVTGLEEREVIIDRLLEAGVKPVKPVVDGPLSGKTFCFTNFRSKTLEAEIKARGGVVKSSVVKNLSVLVNGIPGKASGKLTKAEAQGGVEIVTPDELREMLGL